MKGLVYWADELGLIPRGSILEACQGSGVVRSVHYQRHPCMGRWWVDELEVGIQLGELRLSLG